MREFQLLVADVLEDELEALCRNYGIWATVRALITTIIRNVFLPSGNRLSDLNGHMRRDIGAPHVIDVDEQRFRQWRGLL